MDYEKAYNEALKRARDYSKGHNIDVNPQAAMAYVFPELKESEDEILRKWLIKYFDKVNDVVEVDRKKIIAWLEKQGKNNMGISEATKQKLEDNLNEALEKETPESWNEFLEKQGEHKCDCKYVGCHVNDVKRWFHKKQAEILYEKCNTKCSEYLKQGEQKPIDKVELL